MPKALQYYPAKPVQDLQYINGESIAVTNDLAPEYCGCGWVVSLTENRQPQLPREQLQEIRRQLNEIAAPHRALLASVDSLAAASFPQQFLEQMRSIGANLQATMYASQLLNIIRPVTGLANLAREIATPEYREFEEEMGWLEFLPMDTAWSLYLASKSGGIQRSWDKLVDDFKKPEVRDELVNDFRRCGLVNMRRSVLELGISHHKSADYISAVYVLLPQVEGLIWEMGVRRGLVSPSINSRNKMDSNGTVLQDEWSLGALVAKIWGQTPFEEYFQDQVYTKDFRHPILHGRRLDLCSEKESTAVLLYLMAVQVKSAELNLC